MEASSLLFMIVWLETIFGQEAFAALLLWDSVFQNGAVSAIVTNFSRSWGILELWTWVFTRSLLSSSAQGNQPVKVRPFTRWHGGRTQTDFSGFSASCTENWKSRDGSDSMLLRLERAIVLFPLHQCSVNKIPAQNTALISCFGFWCRQAIKKKIYIDLLYELRRRHGLLEKNLTFF